MAPLTTHELSDSDRLQLGTLHANLRDEAGQYLGFPWNAKFEYSELFRFLDYPINNDGDPFAESPYHLNTHAFERDVVNTFAGFMGAKKGEFWGYITSGGTEGNLYGVFSARELLPDGVFYCSRETFSLKRLLSSLGARSEIVRSHDNGCMDVEHLGELLKKNCNVPAIILANIGTTLKGAVDDLPGIHRSITQSGVCDYYIHADAALSGMVLPFVNDAPPWDFKAGVDSLSIQCFLSPSETPSQVAT